MTLDCAGNFYSHGEIMGKKTERLPIFYCYGIHLYNRFIDMKSELQTHLNLCPGLRLLNHG